MDPLIMLLLITRVRYGGQQGKGSIDIWGSIKFYLNMNI